MIRLGSLFDGIGGFPLAASIHDIEPVWASEIEGFPIEVTKIRFPNMKHLGDITQINGAEIEPVDIISAGSPCQDLSVAGKREGLAGKRSGLFMEFIRIVREMRNATANEYPRFILWENVPGAFSSNGGQDFRAVIKEIAESEIPMPKSGRWATAGMVRGQKYSIAWRVLDAQYFGVPQRRKRIFLVCDFAGQRAGEILFESEGLSRDTQESRKAREEVTACAGDGIRTTSYGLDSYNQTMSEEIINPIRSASGGDTKPMVLAVGTVSAKWAKGTGGPAGVVYGICSYSSNSMKSNNPHSGIYEAKTSRTLDLNGGNPACNQGGIVIVNEKEQTCFNKTGFAKFKEGCGTLRASGGDNGGGSENLIQQNYTVRRLTVTECLRLQGFPDWWLDGVPGYSDTQGYKTTGNSVAILCVAWIMGQIARRYRNGQAPLP